MQSRPAGPPCCGRCAGADLAARAARRQRFQAAVAARPGGNLSGPSRAGGPGAGPGSSGGTADGAAGRYRVVTGTLLDVTPHILVVAGGEGEQRLTLTPGATIWYGRTVTPTELRPGERVIARQVPGRRNVADKVWAGIGRAAGTIIASEPTGLLTVDEGRTRPRREVIISPAAANQIRVRFPQLEPGSLIDVIGLRRGAVLEALIPATSQPAYLASRVTRRPAVVKTASRTFRGSATWHEPAEPGEEPRGIAYPVIDPSACCAEAIAAALDVAAHPRAPGQGLPRPAVPGGSPAPHHPAPHLAPRHPALLHPATPRHTTPPGPAVPPGLAVPHDLGGPAGPGPHGSQGIPASLAALPNPAALPYLAVGSLLSVRNECTAATQVLPVTGCAAAARLFHDRCLTCGTSARGRVADLTMASFAELGGELERGCFNATVTVWP